MAKWEYCKLVQGVQTGDNRRAGVKFLTPGGGGKVENEIDDLDRRLAQLGAEGWELVSHTQVWEVAVQKEKVTGSFPVMEVYFLKREIED